MYLLGHGHNVFSTSRGTIMSLATSNASIKVLSFSHRERHLFPNPVRRNHCCKWHPHGLLTGKPRHLEWSPRKQVTVCFANAVDRHSDSPDEMTLVIYCTGINLPIFWNDGCKLTPLLSVLTVERRQVSGFPTMQTTQSSDQHKC